MIFTLDGTPEEIAEFFTTHLIQRIGASAQHPASDLPVASFMARVASTKDALNESVAVLVPPEIFQIDDAPDQVIHDQVREATEAKPDLPAQPYFAGAGFETKVNPDKFFKHSATEYDLPIMNLIVDNPGITARAISEKLNTSRQKISHILRGFEKVGYVSSVLNESNVSEFTAQIIQRENQRSLPGDTTKREAIREVIEKHPGQTTAQIGQRLLLSTMDVSAGCTPYLDIDLRREGTGTRSDPFRWYIR